MASTIIGYFDDFNEAKQTEQDLIQSGFDRSQVSLIAGEQTSAKQQHEPSAWEEFKSWLGLTSEEDRIAYEEATRRGATMVSVRAPEERTEQAAEIIDRHHPIDLDRRVEEWRRTGWTGYMPSQQPTAGQTASGATGRVEGEGEQRESIPVVEEELSVGKRSIRRGGVRIHKQVREIPVQEQVNLREEQVRVERHPTDRPVTARDQAFRERTVEATETTEEPVVQKEARVREEVELKKDVRQRKQQVRDTVRREEVDVEPIEGGTSARQAGATTSEFDTVYREDFDRNYARSGATYEHYRPAYEFGRDLALDARWRERDWKEVEPEARRAFEARNPNTWDRYGPAVKTGFMGARSRSR